MNHNSVRTPMESNIFTVISLVLFTLLNFGYSTADLEALCHQRCTYKIVYLSKWSFSQAYLTQTYVECKNNCLYPNQGVSGQIPFEGKPATPQPTRRPNVITTPRPTPPRTTTTTTTRATIVTRPPIKWRFTTTPIPPGPVRPPQVDCGFRRQFTSRIINGLPTDNCEFPWMVVVRVPNDFCGGAILDKRHILTAAHCLKDLFYNQPIPAADIEVKVGSSFQSRLYSVKAARTFVHPKHDFFRNYDVAVIRLERDLVFGPCVAPVCLPAQGQRAEQMQECVVTGWGILDSPSSGYPKRQPDVLQKLTLPIVSRDKCLKAYRCNYFNDLKICAGFYEQGGRDSCKGDSGGPLMCRTGNGPFSVFGIVAFGNGCAKRHYPGVYTRVNHPHIMTYILQSINSNF